MNDIVNNTDRNRYELLVDGSLSVAEYEREGYSLTITHVEVPQVLRGKGVAARLMAGVVLDAKKQNLTIIPVCSYAAAYLERHPQ